MNLHLEITLTKIGTGRSNFTQLRTVPPYMNTVTLNFVTTTTILSLLSNGT